MKIEPNGYDDALLVIAIIAALAIVGLVYVTS